MEKIMEIIEQIWVIDLVRFIVFLLVAFIAAGIAKLLVTKILKLSKVDKLFDKWGINDGPVGTSMNFVGRLVYLIVFLMFLPSALDALGLTSVSDLEAYFSPEEITQNLLFDKVLEYLAEQAVPAAK